jgi:hypothetical protein
VPNRKQQGAQCSGVDQLLCRQIDADLTQADPMDLPKIPRSQAKRPKSAFLMGADR